MSSSLLARLGLDTADFRAGLSRARSEVGGFASAAVAGLSIAGMGAAANEVINFASTLADSAAALGINVEALQELDYAFGQSGTSSQQVSKGLSKLTQSLDAARGGNASTITSFEKLGVTWEDLHTLSPDEILMKMADGFRDSKDPAAAFTAIIDTLGKSGEKMAAGFRSGAAGIKQLREEAAKLTQEQIDELDQAGDRLTKGGNKMKVWGGNALSSLSNPTGTGSLFDQISDGLESMTGSDFARSNDINTSLTPEELATERAKMLARKAAGPAGIPENPGAAKSREGVEKEMEKSRDRSAKAQEAIAKATAEAYEEQTKTLENAQKTADLRARSLSTEEQLLTAEGKRGVLAFQAENSEGLRKSELELQTAEMDEQLRTLREQLSAEAQAVEQKKDSLAKEKEITAEKVKQEKATLRSATIAAMLAGPDARRDNKRQAGREGRAGRRVDRMEALESRGGRSEVDKRDSATDFTDGLKPRMGAGLKPLLGDLMKPILRKAQAGGEQGQAPAADPALSFTEATGYLKTIAEKFGVSL